MAYIPVADRPPEQRLLDALKKANKHLRAALDFLDAGVALEDPRGTYESFLGLTRLLTPIIEKELRRRDGKATLGPQVSLAGHLFLAEENDGKRSRGQGSERRMDG